MKAKIGLLAVLFSLCGAYGHAQGEEYTLIHRGNRSFAAKQYAEAELFYRRALSVNPRSGRAYYNLGNTQLARQNAKEAMKMYETALGMEQNRIVKGMTYHNMGVIMQGQKQYAEAIECYKNALRQAPYQDDSRYNLALCQYLLKKQPPQPDNDKQNDKQGRQQQQQEQNKSKADEQKKQQQDQSRMTRQNAESLLKNVVEREERNTQEKLRKSRQQPVGKQPEKNW